MQVLRQLDRRSLLIAVLAALLAVALLTGSGRAQDQAAAAAQQRYQIAMAGTRSCWVLDNATGEMYKCVTDSGYDPVECEWFHCGTPQQQAKRLKLR
jgi:hypothetical protein